MTNTDTLHVEPTPLGWVAYFDPEGLNGHGKTREEALTELLDQTDECWRRTMDERKEEARKAILRGEELNKWQDLAQKITGVDANDHGWLRSEIEQRFANVTTERDKLHRRMEAMFPLFQEARDALTAIPLASAKLRGIDLTLGDRMDDVGIPERWNAREEREALEAK